MVWAVFLVVQQTEQICLYQYLFLENIGQCRIVIPGKDVNVVDPENGLRVSSEGPKSPS